MFSLSGIRCGIRFYIHTRFWAVGHTILLRRFAELEAAATAHQAALLADLAAEEQTAANAKHRRGHRGKKKKKPGSTGQFPGSAPSTEEGAVADPEGAKEPLSCSEATADSSLDSLVEAPGNRKGEEPIFVKDALVTGEPERLAAVVRRKV